MSFTILPLSVSRRFAFLSLFLTMTESFSGKLLNLIMPLPMVLSNHGCSFTGINLRMILVILRRL